jgi:signal transduction histidine kinase
MTGFMNSLTLSLFILALVPLLGMIAPQIVSAGFTVSPQLKYLFFASGGAAFCGAVVLSIFQHKKIHRLHLSVMNIVKSLDDDEHEQTNKHSIMEIEQIHAALGVIIQKVHDLKNSLKHSDSNSKRVSNELERHYSVQIAELREINAQLRHAVSMRKYVEGGILKAKSVAESASKAKSEFLANMSHELRTPLNHIIGFTEILIEGSLGTLSEIQAEYLSDVLDSSKHLLSLINDILDLSKVESGKLELNSSDIDLELLIENSLVMIKEKALKHGISLNTRYENPPDRFRADERKLKQILYNLLSNAIKFTPDGGDITVSVEQLEDTVISDTEFHRGSVIISVQDTGIGIVKDNLDRVFNPFEQIDSSTNRHAEGTGLGLALTRKLVHLHDGKIWAESEGENRGSTFKFILPMKHTEHLVQ